LALGAQGFGARPAKASAAQLRKLAARLHAFQIDSVNVLVRAHYVPAFARLGPYRREDLDTLAYRKHELFEYWGHEACLMPVSLYPLLRYRMDRHREHTQAYMRSKDGRYMAGVFAEVVERGPLSAGELTQPGERSSGWWGWWGSGNGKATLEHLYDAGLVAIAGRRGFERLYDIPERVFPDSVCNAPLLPQEEAMKRLICLAAKAHGVATAADLTSYFRLEAWRDRMPAGPRWAWESGDRQRPKPVAKRLLAELVEEKRLGPARVEGWKEAAYLHPVARIPRTMDARGIVTPFDSLVWERSRMERLFGMKYSIEMYTPAPKRVFGYYVCPFLLGDTLVARCDLKADRGSGRLLVQSAFLEPKQSARRVAEALTEELELTRAWLGLDRIAVGDRGDLARMVRRACGGRDV
jgi:uncharacterized protein